MSGGMYSVLYPMKRACPSESFLQQYLGSMLEKIHAVVSVHVGRFKDRPEKATLGSFMRDGGSRAERRRGEDRPSIAARSDNARRSSPGRREEHRSKNAHEGGRLKEGGPSRRLATPPLMAQVNADDLPPHLRK